MFGLTLFVIYGVGKMMLPADNSNDELVLKGDASGGWGAEHNHPVGTSGSKTGDIYPPPSGTNSAWDTPVSHYDESSISSASSSYNSEKVDLELRESDLLMVLSPLLFIPSHSRPEYEKYQTESGASTYSEEVLYDKRTPHGMAFDFMVNRDKRPVHHDDALVTQRFVLTLLFYATGGKQDEHTSPSSSIEGGRTSGWDAGMAHFLTGLHECHWVKKSVEDQFWGMLSMDGDSDRRVGVTKCNSDMEVTEIRLADLNLVGFIPEEIKWLSSLVSLDIQNNHLAGPIPGSLGELDELKYLSLDGNNFSGTIPDVFDNLLNLGKQNSINDFCLPLEINLLHLLFYKERAYLNFNDFNGAMPMSLCTLREEGALKDLWSDCGGYPITCTCCTVCCDMVAECNEMESQKGN